jgi:PAS domain S-box-containing protein
MNVLQDEEDDDIGALGSILSWDEDEEGGGGAAINASLSDQNSVHNSALPDLVSFNLKDGGASSYLQQLNTGAGGTIDPSALNLPLPTRINFQQDNSQAPSPEEGNGSRTKPQRTTTGSASAAAVAVTQAQQQEQLQQQQQQIQQQQQQIQLQQQQIQQNHHLQQKFQQQQQQQQMGGPSGASQQQVAQQLAQQQAVAAAAASLPAHLQGAFNLLQQNAMLAQQTQNAMNMQQHQPANQEHATDQQKQPSAQQFIDPNAFLRQLQVAQLQQQFNAVQQAAQAQSQQHVGPAGNGGNGSLSQAAVAQQLQQQFQQTPMSLASAPTGQTLAAKKQSAKKTTPSQIAKDLANFSSAAAKASLVSASDTDGELSLKQLSQRKAVAKKPPAARKKAEIDMSNMSVEEKRDVNRDRNREHARNTRLRKKAYLEKLKATVDELCRERDTLVSERAGAANILVEMNNTRTEVLMSFFALRSANEKRRELWASILDESRFACVMPVTPYRSFPASEVQVSKCQRTILGIDGMMSDTASLHVLLNSLVDRSRFPNAVIVFRYTLVTEEAVVAGNQMMARWVMTTLNATQCGARMEVAKQGMLCCKFNSAHKIIGVELTFDVMALMLQLKQAAGSDTFSVIPNTVQTCQRSFDKPMMMILAEEPYTIVQVNKLWEEMAGYTAEEVVGKTSNRILEGEQSDNNAVEVLMNEIRFKRPASAMILHYKKSGERFRNFFLAYPLSTDSRITHYLIFTTHVGPIVDINQAPSTASASFLALQAPSPTVANNNFLAQDLQANFNAAKNSAGFTVSQPMMAAFPPALDSYSGATPPPMMMQTGLTPLPSAPMNDPFPSINPMDSIASNSMKRSHPNDNNGSNDAKMPRTDGQSGFSAATSDMNG